MEKLKLKVKKVKVVDLPSYCSRTPVLLRQ